MPNRILKDTICVSDNIDALTAEQEAFFYRLIVQCDDFGRMDARPVVVRSKCYPLRIDSMSNQMIADYIVALALAGLIQVYKIDGEICLQMVTWTKHQQVRAKKSKYPAPDGDVFLSPEIICNHLIATDNKCTRNPIQSNPIRNPIQSNTTTSEVKPSDAAMGLADKLKDLILTNNPKAKTPQNLIGWAHEIDKMMRLDKRTESEISEIIEFSQHDQFWLSNILSAASLREKYDRLFLKMIGGKQNDTQANRGNPQRLKTGAELIEANERYEREHGGPDV